MTTAVLVSLGVAVILFAIGTLIINRLMPSESVSVRKEPKQVVRLRRWYKDLTQLERTLFLAAVAAGLVVAVATGWMPSLVVLPAASIILPRLFSTHAEKAVMRRLEDMEAWTRSLCGLISTGTSLEMALRSSRATVGASIAPEVHRAVARIDGGWSTARALQGLAKEINDPTGDLIITNLMLAARQRGGGLMDSLNAVADNVQEEIRTRNEVSADRASVRFNVRIVVVLTLTMIVLLPFVPALKAGYETGLGQIVYLGCTGAIGAILLSMYRLSQPSKQPRILEEEPA